MTELSTHAAGDHPLLLKDSEPLFEPVQSVREGLASLRHLDWRQAFGGLLLLAGLVALLLGWVGIANTPETYKQLSFLMSGGLGGLGLIAAGAVFLTSYEHFLDRFAIARLEQRLDRIESAAAPIDESRPARPIAISPSPTRRATSD